MPEADTYTLPTDVLDRLTATAEGMSALLVAFTADLSGERDDALNRAREAEALNATLVKALADLVDAYPVTSWATSNDALDTARQTLAEIEQEGATMGSAEPPTEQETVTHGTTPHRNPASPDGD